MKQDIATPDLLALAPELAAVELLEHAADTAFRSLVAAHPELNEPEFLLEHASVTPELCLANSVLSAVRTLSDALNDYRLYTERCTSMRSNDRDIPF